MVAIGFTLVTPGSDDEFPVTSQDDAVEEGCVVRFVIGCVAWFVIACVLRFAAVCVVIVGVADFCVGPVVDMTFVFGWDV